jgi:pimeloyl-ACP methyl ester carboxylesterase
VTDGRGPAPRRPEPFSLTTPDGVTLSVQRYGSVDADIAVVFGHGFTGSQRNKKIVALAGRLAERGFAVYTADFRGHGASGGLSASAIRRFRTSKPCLRSRAVTTERS